MIQLREKDLIRLEKIFSEFPVSIRVWAYGSRVNGNAHDGSDLDLVVEANNGQPISFRLFSQLKDHIQESNIPILVDLKDYNKIPENFKPEILRNRALLFSSPVSG